MTILSIAAVGLLCLLIGLCLSAMGLCAFLLHRAASAMQLDTTRAHQGLTSHVREMTAEIHQLRQELTGGLMKLNAEEMRETAVSLQRTGKHLASTCAMLYKLVLSQPEAGAVVEDVLGQDLSQEDALSHDKAQALINEIQRRAGVPMGEPGPAQSPMLDIQEAWAQDERGIL